MKACFFCGKNGYGDRLDIHHIFGGPNRDKSTKYGLVVCLCHHECHIFGKDSIHGGTSNEANRRRLLLHRYGQLKAMYENGWTIEQFIKEFGKSYINRDEADDLFITGQYYEIAMRGYSNDN